MHPTDPAGSRRDFLKKSSLAAAGLSVGLDAIAAPDFKSILGANDKVRVGFIGLGNRGSQLLNLFMGQPGVEIAALCDVYEPYLLRDRAKVHPRLLDEIGGQIPKMGEQFPKKVARHKDFRKLLDAKDIDAVVIATPDHWHALQTLAALDAGKDIYVEKPLTNTLREGRMMVEAAAKTDRVVAVGLNRRGSSVYQGLAPQVQGGKIGKVTLARAYRVSNMYPDGIGNAKPEAPPPGLDWDLWLGPREARPYQYNIAPYRFRWWKEYSSQMGNWGVHYMDVCRWLMGETAPVAVTAHGGKYALKDDRNIPDTMEVTFEFPSGALAVFGIYEASGGPVVPEGEVELRGTKGNLYASENGYRVVPVKPGQFQQWDALVEAEEKAVQGSQTYGDLNTKEDTTANLIRNFVDCVKSRQAPLCPLEEGHRSTSFAHLANIALETKTRLEWDPQRERFTNHEKANELLHYPYRKPWVLS